MTLRLALFMLLVGLLGWRDPLRAAAPEAFLGVLLEFTFDNPELAGSAAGQGWTPVKIGDRGFLCISNYHAQYGNFPKFLFGDPDWQNYSIEAEVFFKVEQQTGHLALLTRLNEAWWGYRHGLIFGGWGMHLSQYYYGGVGATNTQAFSGADLPPPVYDWYVLRGEVDGRTMRTLINETLVIDYNLRLSDQGIAGLEVGPGVYMCVDRLVVRSLNRSAAALAAARRGDLRRGANVRLWPGFRHEKIAEVRAGEEVFVLRTVGDWMQIRKQYSSVQGWVWAPNIQIRP